MAISAPGPCAHDKPVRVAGLHGGGSEDRTNRPGRGGYTPSVAARRRLAGTPWMSLAGVGQSIPPVYTEHLGRQLLAYPRTCSETEDLADGRQGPAVAPGGRHWKVTGPWNDQSAVIVMSPPG